MAKHVEESKNNLKQTNKKFSAALQKNKVLGGENIKLKKQLKQAESIQNLFDYQSGLINSTNVFLTFIDKNYRYTIVNDRWCGFIGKNRSEVIGKKISTFWGKKEFEKEIKPRFDKALKGKTVHYQHWLKNFKGDNRYFDIYFNPFRKEHSIEGILVTSIDITDRINAEETVRISEHRNRTLVDAIPDIMFRVNRNGTFLDYKTDTHDKLYVQPEKFLGKKFNHILPKEIADTCFSVLEKTFSTKQLQTFKFQLAIGETPSTFEARVKVVPDTDEAIVIIRNITEQTDYESRLKKERDVVLKILESMSDAFVALDKNWCYTYMNEKAGLIFNRNPKDMIGKHIWTEFPEGIGQPFQLAYEKAMKEKTTITLEEYYPPYNKWFENYICPLDDGLQIFFRDVTERKEIALKIENERKRLQTLIETIPDPIWVKDPDGVYLLCNPAYEKLFGMKASKIIGKTDYDVVPKEVAEMFKKNDMDVLKENRSITYFEEVKFVNGEQKAYFESTKTPLYDAEGKLIGTLGIAREVTTLVEINKALEESEAKLKEAQRIAKIGHWELNLLTNKLDWSDEIFKIFEIDPQKFQASYEAFLNAIHPEDREMVNEAYNVSLKNHSQYDIIHRLLMPDGRIKFVNEKCYTEYNESGNPIRSIGTVQDVTERKIIESALDAERILLRTLIDNLPDAIYVKDTEFRKVLVNKADLENIGKSEAEVIGKTDFDFFPSETAAQTVKDDEYVVKEGKAILYKEEFLINAKGNKKWLLTSKLPLYNKEGKITGLVGIGHDITENKKIIEELITAKEKAEEMNRIKSVFLANMSHELRTPLVGLLGFSEALVNELTGEQKEYAEYIYQGGERLLRTLSNLLDYSLIEAERKKLHYQAISLVALLNDEINLYAAMAKNKGLHILKDYSIEQLYINTDEKILRKIIDILINNAVKFTDKGKITIVLKKEDETAIVSIKDTGIGISKENIELIFEEFRQASEGDNRSFQGTGLGLTLAKKYLSLLNGKIEVESEVGTGSTFTISLPIGSQPVKREDLFTEF